VLRRKKGVSGIISGLFVVLVSVSIFSMSYLQIVQQDHYNQFVLDRMQRDWARFNERMEITETAVSGSYLRFKLHNTGSVIVHLVTVYINDTTTNTPRDLLLSNYITSNCSAYLNSGAEAWIYTTITVTLGNSYDLKVASERGNIATVVTGTCYATRPGSFIFGSLPFSFESTSFNYTTTSDGDYWRSHSRPAWEMIGGKANIIFWVKISNHASQSIEISKLSYLMIVRPHSDTTEDEYYFHMVDPASISGSVTAYQDYSQSIPCNSEDPGEGGPPTLVKFGATQPSGTALRSMPSPVGDYSSERKYLYTSQLVMFWRWSGTTQYYGLVVPFAAIHMVSS
jgi:hypothetical protein